jgi:hypothetical protein
MGFITIDNEYYRTPEFIKFGKTVRSRYLEFIIAHIVRESQFVKDDPTHGAYYIYKNHFMEGELVARFRQEDMAKYFETRQSNMSRELSKLEKEGFIKKIARCTNKAKILYYQVGTWSGKLGVEEGPDKYEEHLWFDEIFGAYSKVAKQKRGEKKPHKFKSMREMVSDVEYDETCEGPFAKH